MSELSLRGGGFSSFPDPFREITTKYFAPVTIK